MGCFGYFKININSTRIFALFYLFLFCWSCLHIFFKHKNNTKLFLVVQKSVKVLNNTLGRIRFCWFPANVKELDCGIFFLAFLRYVNLSPMRFMRLLILFSSRSLIIKNIKQDLYVNYKKKKIFQGGCRSYKNCTVSNA